MPIVGSVLMCHAPIVIPAVGGRRGEACRATTASMALAAKDLVAAAPDVVVCLSPHAPRRRHAFGVQRGGLASDFARFGAPHAAVALGGDDDAVRAIVAAAGPDLAAEAEAPSVGKLDHGAAVPLWFAEQAGWSGPTVVVALPGEVDHARCRAFGEALASAAHDDGRRYFVLASGDMSHCLEPGAPSGYHPDGALFDRAFVALLASARSRGRADELPQLLRGELAELDALREHAAEDVVDTFEIAAASLGSALRPEVLSYEGPFGVGYSVARLSLAGTDGDSARGGASC